MTKHIHIHLHRASAKARDAGFDESKHKRDHGKFSTTSGDAAHHEQAAAKHDETRQGLPSMHDDKHHHLKASMRHEEAAQYLKSAANAKAAGNHALAAEHHKTAEQLAQHAKQHEAQLSTHQKQPSGDMDLQAALEKRNPRATLPSTLPEEQGEGRGLDHPGLADANLKPTKATASGTTVPHQAPKPTGLYAKKYPEGTHVIHSSGGYAGKVVGHEGEHVHVQKPGEQPRKLLGGRLRHDTARHIDPKAAASAYAGTHAGPLHIGSTKK